MARKGQASAPRVRTLMGRVLIARPLGRQEELAAFAAASAADPSAWTDDDDAVARAACELAVRQYFRPGYTAADVTEVAAWLRDVTDTGLTSDLPAVEALIREALGESGVDVTGVTPATRVFVHIVLFEAIAREHLRGDERLVTEMMSRAERNAWHRGWNPRRAAR